MLNVIQPEYFARPDAKLRHGILLILDAHIEAHAHESDPRFLFLDIEAMANALRREPAEVLGHLQVLHASDLVHPTTYGDNQEVFTLTQAGKVAMVRRDLLVESGERQFNFLRNWIAVLISMAALAVSIIALVKSA